MSARGFTPEQAAAVSAPHVQIAQLLEVDIPGDPARLFTGFGQLSAAGKTWLGVGLLGRVGEARETVSGEVTGAVYELSGVSNPAGEGLLDALLDADAENAPVTASVLLFDPVAGAPIGDPVTILSHQLDTVTRDVSDTNATLRLTAEPPGLDRSLRGARTYSPASQRARFPEDTGMDRQPSVGIEPIILDG